MTKLQGVLTALPAPLNSEGQLVLDVLGRHIEDSIDAGVAGFWVNGGTGCAMYLDLPQRKQILKESMAAVAGRVPVLALVSAMSLRDGIALAEHAGELGIAGVSALPPIFYKTTLACTIDYITALRKASGLPMTYYHMPGSTHVPLDASELAQLCEQVPLQAIKFSDGDFWKAIELHNRCPELSILFGFEELLLGGMALGCVDGTVGAGQNFMPSPLVEQYEAMKRGDLARAQELQTGIARLAEVQGMFDVTATTYGIMKLLGYDFGNPVAPMPRLDDLQMARLSDALTKVVGPEPLVEGRLIESRDITNCEPDTSKALPDFLPPAHFKRRRDRAVQDGKNA